MKANHWAEFSDIIQLIYREHNKHLLLNYCYESHQNLKTYGLETYICGKLLEHFPSQDIPQEMYHNFLQHQFRWEIINNEAQCILRKYIDQNISVIPLKGIWMAWKIFNHPAMRTFGDIDLWIDKKNINSCENILIQMGYTPNKDKNLRKYLHFHTSYHKSVNGIPLVIELHWSLSCNRLESIPWSQVWNNKQKINYNGLTFYELKEDEQCLYLLYHSAHHLFDRPARILDCIEVLQWYLNLNSKNSITDIINLSHTYQCSGFIYLCCSLLESCGYIPTTSEYTIPNKISSISNSFQNSFPKKISQYSKHKFSLAPNKFKAIKATLSPSRLILKKWG